MKTISIVKLMLVFAVVFSLASFSGAISSNFQLPSVHVARATVAPCSTAGSPCSESWVPAGPAMDTFLATIFTDESAEFQNIQGATPSIDLTDWPLTPDLLSPFTTNSAFYITSTISEHGYFEIEFMLGAGNFWGCNMNFGNSQCGIDIRQGISHLIDKTKFTSADPTVKGTSSAIDNPMPTSNGGLLSPNPCAWDKGVVPASLVPVLGTSLVQTGSNCKVGSPGGTAYHLASASGGGGTAWLPSASDLDMCAAAAHFIDAGLAASIVSNGTIASLGPRNCALKGLSSSVTSGTIFFFVRSDNTPRLDLGDSLAQAICALFTGGYTTGCGLSPSTTNILSVIHGPITAFTGFTTSVDHIDGSWEMYTGAFGNVFPFDSSLYLGYNSRFVSGISSIHVANGGTCDNGSVPTNSAGNYMYVCSVNYDSISRQMEFANCLTAEVGTDPTVSQTTPTFGSCTAGHGGGLSAVSAGYQAEDLFGSKAFTFPIFQQADQFGYLSHTPGNTAATWSRAINHFGNGLANYYTWLNAWNTAPAQPGTIRQGFKQTTRTVSPYIGSTVWDFYMIGNVYDTLHNVNPLNNAEDLSWMDVSALPQTTLTYTPPAGTVLTYRFTLMPNLSWQDGKPVTSFDVAFSYLSLLANGAFQSGGASTLSGVTILSPTQFDLNLKSTGPFTRLFLTGVSIMPGRYWTCGTGAGLGQNCAPGNIMNPGTGQSYTLQRNGLGIAPGFPGDYFRSSGFLATWLWSGDIAPGVTNFSAAKACFGVTPLDHLAASPPASACGRWQQGIGTNGATTPAGTGGCSAGATPCGIPVGSNQVSIVKLYININWVYPDVWNSINPPNGIIALDPVLYAGSAGTLSPATGTGSVGCASAYPTGGYDC